MDFQNDFRKDQYTYTQGVNQTRLCATKHSLTRLSIVLEVPYNLISLDLEYHKDTSLHSGDIGCFWRPMPPYT